MIIYFIGNEDDALVGIGGAVIDTTSTTFRTGLNLRNSWKCLSASPSVQFVMNRKAFAQSLFYFTARMVNPSGLSGTGTTQVQLQFLDVNQIPRLRFRISSMAGSVVTLVCETLTAAGVATQVGSSFAFTQGASSSPAKLDVRINYAVAGDIAVYQAGIATAIFTYSGDITTNGVTSLAYFACGSCASAGNANDWSEICVSDTLMLSMSVGMQIPSANGNTHNFDTGSPAAANINETTLNDLTYDGSTTAGQIDQYTLASAPTGTYVVQAWVPSVRAAVGASGPTKFEMGYRTGGVDTWSSDITPTVNLDLYQNPVYTNAVTGLPFTQADLAAAGFNIGVRSVA